MSEPAREPTPTRQWESAAADRPRAFAHSELVLRRGQSRPYCSDEWDGALVVVADGVLEIGCRAGGVRTFPTGSVLALNGLPLLWLQAGEGRDVVLLTLRRRGL